MLITRRRLSLFAALTVALMVAGACGGSDSPAEAGERLFNKKGIPKVNLGDACSTCHTITGGAGPWGPRSKA